MAEEVEVLRLGEREFAAHVREGHQATEHRVVFPDELAREIDETGVDEVLLIAESVKYLLQKQPVTALPHDIDLEAVRNRDPEYVPELRARLAAR